jgi:hypothetical protein
MKEDVIGYKMTKEVNKIVSLFQSKAFIKVEGKIKEKYLDTGKCVRYNSKGVSPMNRWTAHIWIRPNSATYEKIRR